MEPGRYSSSRRPAGLCFNLLRLCGVILYYWLALRIPVISDPVLRSITASAASCLLRGIVPVRRAALVEGPRMNTRLVAVAALAMAA